MVKKNFSQISTRLSKVLLMQATGLGDVVSVFPAIKTLKMNYPHASINVLCWKNGSEVLLENNPFVDNTITSTLTFSPDNFFSLIPYLFLNLVPRLRKEKFDCVISFHPNKVRWLIIKLLSPRYYVYQTEYLPLTQTALEAVSAIGCTKLNKKSYLYTKNYDEDIKKFNLNNQDIVICINLYTKSKMRHWNRFPDLITQSAKANSNVIIIGQNKDHKKMQGVIDLVNQTTLQEMINIIKRADLFVTADSGPMHIAFAMGCLTIALFGKSKPEDVLPLESLPLEDRDHLILIYNTLECSPCAIKDTWGGNCSNVRCMDSISIEQVFNAIEKSLPKLRAEKLL